MELRNWAILLCFVSAMAVGFAIDDERRTAADDKKFTSAEHRLKLFLTKDYDTDIFPTRYTNETLIVNVGMAVINILNVDEVKQELEMKTWMRLTWQDYRFVWSPEEYDGVTVLRIWSHLVWLPDISLYNGNGDIMITSNYGSVLIYNNGDVVMITQRNLKSFCDFNLRDFPYDKHVCTIKFGSWSFDGQRMDLQLYEKNDKIDLEDFNPFHEFTVTNTSVTRNIRKYACCEEPYVDLTFALHLSRNPGFYIHFFVSPAVVMFLLMPFVFLIKPTNGRSTVLGVGIMICSTLLITEVMKPSFANKTPTILIYYTTIFIMVGICLAVKFIIDMMWGHSGSHSPPHPLNTFFVTRLGHMVFVQVEDFHQSTSDDTGEQKMDIRAEKRAQWQALSLSISRLLFITLLIINIFITIILFA